MSDIWVILYDTESGDAGYFGYFTKEIDHAFAADFLKQKMPEEFENDRYPTVSWSIERLSPLSI